MSNYWKDREAESQNKLNEKNQKEIEKQLKKYYARATERVIADFEATYDKLLATAGEPTPADLYKLDKYWKNQAALRAELERLGEKQISAMTKIFETHFFDIYNSIEVRGLEAFTSLDKTIVKQLINSVWCADGKHFSNRIWSNTEKLIETLNEELVHCVVVGQKTTYLKKELMARFGVAYRNADMIARTELAHIQTQAAQQRYKDYGLKEVEIWADADERRCDVCGQLHKKRYPINAKVPIPAHPRCRCCIIPVVE